MLATCPRACRRRTRSRPAATAVDAEVVDLCRELIRIDTSNYGDDSGPGERKAAEYVADAARRGRDRVPALRVRARSDVGGGALGRVGGRPAAAARPPGRRAGRRRGLAGRPVRGRDRGRLPLGPRRGRHEGLRRDAAGGRPAPPAHRPGARAAGRARASPPTRRPAVTSAPQVLVEQHREEFEGCTEAVGEVGGFSTTVRGRRLYLIEAAEKGMAWMQAHRPRHGRPRLDDQPRQRRRRG